MDQEKIGEFISEKRKEKGLTQAELAEKLGITDRAVSKWERGKSLPDASIMLELCSILGITVNDLLSGEVVSMENYGKENEKNLIEMVKLKEASDKRLLSLEIVIGVISSLFLFSTVAAGAWLGKSGAEAWIPVVVICFGFLQFIVAMAFAIRVEQVAGYYECKECGHRYVPSYVSVLFAMHTGRTRYMKCPECGKRSWQKKVVSK